MNHKPFQALFTFLCVCVEGLEVGGFISQQCLIAVFVITLEYYEPNLKFPWKED